MATFPWDALFSHRLAALSTVRMVEFGSCPSWIDPAFQLGLHRQTASRP